MALEFIPFGSNLLVYVFIVPSVVFGMNITYFMPIYVSVRDRMIRTYDTDGLHSLSVSIFLNAKKLKHHFRKSLKILVKYENK